MSVFFSNSFMFLVPTIAPIFISLTKEAADSLLVTL